MPVFISTRAALPVTEHEFATNTNGTEVERVAAISRFTIEFDSPINPNFLGSPPYDPYITSQRDADEYDIHLPGKEGFSDRPGFLPLETGALSFLDDNGFPWVIELPSDWRWPTESREVWLGYPTFTSWVNSAGALNPSWYGSPVTAGSLVALPPADYARTQSFTIGTP